MNIYLNCVFENKVILQVEYFLEGMVLTENRLGCIWSLQVPSHYHISDKYDKSKNHDFWLVIKGEFAHIFSKEFLDIALIVVLRKFNSNIVEQW